MDMPEEVLLGGKHKETLTGLIFQTHLSDDRHRHLKNQMVYHWLGLSLGLYWWGLGGGRIDIE